jgi:hypothetical protein
MMCFLPNVSIELNGVSCVSIVAVHLIQHIAMKQDFNGGSVQLKRRQRWDFLASATLTQPTSKSASINLILAK